METDTPSGTAEERLAAAERALDEALEERNRLWAQLREQEADRRELEDLRKELYGIRSSTFWTVFGRYQRLKRLVRVGLERLRQG